MTLLVDGVAAPLQASGVGAVVVVALLLVLLRLLLGPLVLTGAVFVLLLPLAVIPEETARHRADGGTLTPVAVRDTADQRTGGGTSHGTASRARGGFLGRWRWRRGGRRRHRVEAGLALGPLIAFVLVLLRLLRTLSLGRIDDDLLGQRRNCEEAGAEEDC